MQFQPICTVKNSRIRIHHYQRCDGRSRRSSTYIYGDPISRIRWYRCGQDPVCIDVTQQHVKLNSMNYELVRAADVPKKAKFGINLDIYPDVGGCGIVAVTTKSGHNQEFYDRESTFTYIILEGNGEFFLDDGAVPVSKGDLLSIPPKTRIHYKGTMKMVLITTPAWKPENEVETKSSVW
jgi:mannose-6-phosphate isomerase-like protein (cupin superfamily)